MKTKLPLIHILMTIFALTACAGTVTKASSAPTTASLACEPLTFAQLPPASCAGTKEAGVRRSADGSCACGNPSYLAVPNGEGRTCVHRNIIRREIRMYREFLDQEGVPDPVLTLEADGTVVHPHVVKLSWLKDDLADLARMLDERTLPSGFDLRVTTIQRVAGTYLRLKGEAKCITIVPNGTSRKGTTDDHGAVSLYD